MAASRRHGANGGPVARGALAGALGGLGAAGLDFALAAGKASAFLPTGRARLLWFLAGLYGAAGALGGVGLALVGLGLGWASDLGGLWRAAFARDGSDEGDRSDDGGGAAREGGRVYAYLVATGAALVALGFAVRPIAAEALVRYHHRGLIAALVGAAAAGLTLALAAGVLLAASALTPLLRVGPRVRLRFSAPPALLALGWTLGLIAGAGAVAALLLSLEGRPRMPRALMALNTALWAPALLLAGLALGHGLTRLAHALAARRASQPGRSTGASARGLLWSPASALVAVALGLALPALAAAAASWSTVRQLDARPLVPLLAALAVGLALALAGVGRGLAQLRPLGRAAFALALPLLLLGLALSVGRADRVRKAAVSFSGLGGPLTQALHAATDLDRDGYSSVLGGGDCNDLDRNVHPGAFDWPDDGIDQDCNGHQASQKPAAPRAWAEVPAAVPPKPNIVLITIDALRADHVGSYGYARPTTPALDALANESVRFSQAWSHAPSTRYSVPAILTGRYPSTIAVNNDPHVHWPPQLLPENRLIAEILKDAGYHTGATLSYYYFERGWKLDQGFDDYDYHLQTLHSMGGDPSKTQGTSARQLADLDVEYLRAHAGERFFLWTHFYDTHFGFQAHPELPESNFGGDEQALYDGEIRFTDYHIGRVLEAIKQAGLWDNTIVIVTSDHGDGFGEHGLPPSQRHGYHLYRNETKVPLLIRVPGIAPRVVDEPVGHVDILPTLLNALRLPRDAEPQLLGDSLLGLMLGQPPARPRRVFQEVWYEGPTSRKAVVTRDWHLIRNLIPDDTVELYDEHGDPEEEHDLAGDGRAPQAEAERTLAADLGAWMDAIALPADFHQKVDGNLSRTPLPFQRALGDQLGGFLTLAGADLATPAPRPGETLDLALVWHATQRVPAGWRVFTHIIGADGRRLNADHDPLEGLLPLERLEPGQWLRDRVRVQLPPGWPPGPTHVEVGLWKSPLRAPAHGPHTRADAVHALELEVARP